MCDYIFVFFFLWIFVKLSQGILCPWICIRDIKKGVFNNIKFYIKELFKVLGKNEVSRLLFAGLTATADGTANS